MTSDKKQKERYFRQLNLAELGETGQEKLNKAKVLIVGAGGLGSAAAQYLAGAGVGLLGLADAGKTTLSNLPRQTLYEMADLEKTKVLSAKEKLALRNPDVKIETYAQYLDEANGAAVIEKYDFIIEATDNFESKYLINDLCVKLKKPFVHAGVLRWEGQVMTFLPGSACLRCFVANPPQYDDDNFNAAEGVINTAPGIIGLIQATETIKYLTNSGELLVNKLLSVDLLKMEFRKVAIAKNEKCEICNG